MKPEITKIKAHIMLRTESGVAELRRQSNKGMARLLADYMEAAELLATYQTAFDTADAKAKERGYSDPGLNDVARKLGVLVTTYGDKTFKLRDQIVNCYPGLHPNTLDFNWAPASVRSRDALTAAWAFINRATGDARELGVSISRSMRLTLTLNEEERATVMPSLEGAWLRYGGGALPVDPDTGNIEGRIFIDEEPVDIEIIFE